MTDRELRSTYRLSQEGDDIIRLVFLKDFPNDELNYRIAVLFAGDLEEIFSQNGYKKFRVLVDVSPLSAEIGYLSHKTREIYARMMDHERVIKTAIFGMNTFYKAGVNLMIAMMRGIGKTRTFVTESEALEWLAKT